MLAEALIFKCPFRAFFRASFPPPFRIIALKHVLFSGCIPGKIQLSQTIPNRASFSLDGIKYPKPFLGSTSEENPTEINSRSTSPNTLEKPVKRAITGAGSADTT